VLTTGFTAAINATMAVGQLSDQITVSGQAPIVDIQSSKQSPRSRVSRFAIFQRTRNIRSVLTLTPGLTNTGLGADCVGGVGVWCNNNIYNLSAHTASNDIDGGTQGRVMVDGTIINTGAAPHHGDDRWLRRRRRQCAGSHRADLRGLGESETGGATINIIPRTGGNRFAATTSSPTRRAITTRVATFAMVGCSAVRGFRRTTASSRNQQRLSAHPRLRHIGGVRRPHQARPRLVLLGGARLAEGRVGRQQDRIWDNKNAGIWGQNYQPDRATPPLQLLN
jgi:hypothetical protein